MCSQPLSVDFELCPTQLAVLSVTIWPIQHIEGGGSKSETADWLYTLLKLSDYSHLVHVGILYFLLQTKDHRLTKLG